MKITFKHRIKKIFGGCYKEPNTENVYQYYGSFNSWIRFKLYNIGKWFTLKSYDLRMILIRIRIFIS